MSLRKPVIKVYIECSACEGIGRCYPYVECNGFSGPFFPTASPCEKCKGTKKVEISIKHPSFKAHYIESLRNRIKYYTKHYREINKEANSYLKLIRKYSKELDKIINKGIKGGKHKQSN